MSRCFALHVYASKLCDVVESHLPNVHAYADDTQLYISFKPDGSATETDAVDALQAYIRDIRTWMVQDKLQLKDAKTEFIIGTRAQLNTLSTINDLLQEGEVKVSAVYSSSFFYNTTSAISFALLIKLSYKFHCAVSVGIQLNGSFHFSHLVLGLYRLESSTAHLPR